MNLRDILEQFSWRTVIDIGLVAILFYQIIAMLKGTRAAQVLIGMLVIFLGYIVSSLLELETLNWIISKFYSSFIFVVIVLFQDDIRRLLTRFGRGPFVSGLDENSGLRVIEEVVNASKNLSHDRIGAIIVFERGIGLDRLYDHSVRVDALVSEQLLVCIFQSFSPLHDGAVIIQKNRMSCASAQLPLSKNASFSKKLGTRHSAAVGISEETDAVVLVVSEETGNISVAWDGQIQRQTSVDAARRTLISLLMPRVEKSTLRAWLDEHEVPARIMKRMRQGWDSVVPYRLTTEARTAHGTDALLAEQRKAATAATEYENRLASAGTALNLRFPRSARVRNAKADGSALVLSGKARHGSASEGSESGAGRVSDAGAEPVVVVRESDRRTALGDRGGQGVLFGSDRDSRSGRGGFGNGLGTTGMEIGAGGPGDPLSDADALDGLGHGTEGQEDEEAFAQNQAAMALSHLGPEDKFVPPILPSPPPRDVSIGGVPLNPPIDDLGPESDGKKRAGDSKEKDESDNGSNDA